MSQDENILLELAKRIAYEGELAARKGTDITSAIGVFEGELDKVASDLGGLDKVPKSFALTAFSIGFKVNPTLSPQLASLRSQQIEEYLNKHTLQTTVRALKAIEEVLTPERSQGAIGTLESYRSPPSVPPVAVRAFVPPQQRTQGSGGRNGL